MKCKMIATWKMAYDGVSQAIPLLKDNKSATLAIETAIQNVENNAAFKSVGYGGLPNKHGIVELDSAFMNGDTLGYGAIMASHSIKNPISVAISLAQKNINCVLAGIGADRYAQENHFPFQNMLTKQAHQEWMDKKNAFSKYKAYQGHDTVCMIAKDNQGSMACGVSTSGLFMKEEGRVGDSPIIGSGFYCDSHIGSVCATGLGEDIMRGCLSIRVLDKVEQGMPIQEALNQILDQHIHRMKQAHKQCEAISLIGMDKDGNYGASTNISEFPYIVVNKEGNAKIHIATYKSGTHSNFITNENWIQTYTGD